MLYYEVTVESGAHRWLLMNLFIIIIIIIGPTIAVAFRGYLSMEIVSLRVVPQGN